MENYNHFITIVAGDNPEEILSKYDLNNKVEPYIVYKYSDAHKIRKFHLELLKATLKGNESNFNEIEKDDIQDKIDNITDMTDDEFYCELVEHFGLDVDEDTGNATSTENPNGKFYCHNIGKNLSVPFILNNGSESFQAKKGDIDWSKMHLNGQEIYVKAWEMVMEGKKPENNYEQNIYDNMKNRKRYFEFFETKEKYVLSNTAFWGYAFVDNTSWKSMDDENANQVEWMSNFYEKFIEPLDDETLLTIYECRKD